MSDCAQGLSRKRPSFVRGQRTMSSQGDLPQRARAAPPSAVAGNVAFHAVGATRRPNPLRSESQTVYREDSGPVGVYSPLGELRDLIPTAIAPPGHHGVTTESGNRRNDQEPAYVVTLGISIAWDIAGKLQETPRNGWHSDFQADDEGSIPFTRSKVLQASR